MIFDLWRFIKPMNQDILKHFNFIKEILHTDIFQRSWTRFTRKEWNIVIFIIKHRGPETIFKEYHKTCWLLIPWYVTFLWSVDEFFNWVSWWFYDLKIFSRFFKSHPISIQNRILVHCFYQFNLLVERSKVSIIFSDTFY